MPYAFCEQIGKEIRDISDEIPFEIPESWEWVRLSSICTKLVDGDHNPPKGEKSTTQYYMLSSTNINHNTLVELNKVRYLNKEIFEKENSRTKVSVGDVFFTSVGSLGRSCVFQGGHNICFQRSVTVISTLIYNYYLKYFFDNPFFQDKIVREATGTAQKGFYLNQLSECIIPLPPLSEQHRIVAKIEQLLPFIEKYEQAETQLTALNTSFPEMLKKSILQESVQGKLVPQNPFDEPASVLLERIRAKKQELIKQGKIKKDKHESAIITRDKIPYEIPDSWVWCKLSDLAILENGDRSSKYPVEADYVEIGIPFFGAKDIDGDMMSFQNVRFISQQKYDELGNGKLVDGDIICLLRGSVGKTAKFEANEQFDTGFICAQMLIIRLLDKSLFGYISSYFKSPDYTNYVESKVTGTAVRQMPAKEMGNLLIPLPPLAEQHRIVAKIEEIMPMIERLTLR